MQRRFVSQARVFGQLAGMTAGEIPLHRLHLIIRGENFVLCIPETVIFISSREIGAHPLLPPAGRELPPNQSARVTIKNMLNFNEHTLEFLYTKC